ISLWHLGSALERQDKKEEALAYYIKSYNAGEPDAVRRTLIEQLYRKINGSLAGLEERIGAVNTPAVEVETPRRDPTTSPVQPTSSSESTKTGTTTSNAVTPIVESPTPSATSSPEVAATSIAQPTASPEMPPLTAPQPSTTSPGSSPTPSPEATTEPISAPTPETPPVTSSITAPAETTGKPRSTVRITGRVRDSNNNPLANVVVVLISPQGTVLASTTDDQGNYSFTVAPSAHSYRIIPSRDGFTFEPGDKILP
ncbi:MAG: carboxypeptidase regulatory-like domain-containing protein, partial [Pyrinomonadaceae bacterium]